MRDEIATLTKELISSPSVTTDIPQLIAIVDIVKKHLPGSPVQSYFKEGIPSLLFSSQPAQKKFKIMLHAHLDVMPADHKQFTPLEKDGKLYGRGAEDTKAAAAAMILVFKGLNKSLSYPLGLQISTDGIFGGKLSTRVQMESGVRSEFVITSEGTDLSIIYQTKGKLVIKLIASDDSTNEAVLRINKTLKTIAKAYPPPKKETEDMTITLLRIETPIEGECHAYLDIRYTAENKSDIFKRVQQLLGEQIAVEIMEDFAPNKTDPNNRYVKRLQEVGEDILKREIILQKTPGASTVNLLAQYCNAVVEFGPVGHDRGHVSIDDEWVNMQSVEDYYEILKKFLLSYNV